MFLHPPLVCTKGKAYGFAHSFGCKTNPVTPPPQNKQTNKQTNKTHKQNNWQQQERPKFVIPCVKLPGLYTVFLNVIECWETRATSWSNQNWKRVRVKSRLVPFAFTCKWLEKFKWHECFLFWFVLFFNHWENSRRQYQNNLELVALALNEKPL